MRIYVLILSILLITSCNSNEIEPPDRLEYKRWVGDIETDELSDADDFKLCNDESQVYQYFNDGNGLQYEGEKISIIETFKDQYSEQEVGQTGLLRIRFIVNCEGVAGRFRLLGMDDDFKFKKFSNTISNELLRITKTLKNWQPKKVESQPIDYYQYLVFKLQDGRIIEILP